ncbi:MAG: DNA repair protein RecO [Pseudomonadota bacterium]
MATQRSPALVLHVRPYRESSALVQFFTRDVGRVVAVMHGVRGDKRRHTVQPFMAGELILVGRGSLQTVRTFDVTARFDLRGDALSGGFYVLELVTRVVDERQSEAQLFHLLVEVLTDLQSIEVSRALSARLRVFEHQLLMLLGFSIDFSRDEQGAPLIAAEHYRFDAELGLQRTHAEHAEAVSGHLLLAIGAANYAEAGAAGAARKIFAQALQPLIGSKPLFSRTLLAPMAGTDG